MTKIIANYQIGRTLGHGKYSKVKYAVDMETKKTHAVKIMNLSSIRRDKMELQIKREIAIMKIMKHKHIVQLKEVLQTDRNIYIVMELVTGGELFDKIVAEKKFTESVARRYFQQLVVAIEYCHSHGIAHRDLKPENLLLDSFDQLKITDFGLSSIVPNKHGGNRLLMTTCGTPNYVAPEVIKEKGYDGFLADVWSMGVILYVMLSGKLPFEDKSIDSLFKKIEAGKVTYPNYIPTDAKDLIQKMLHVNPKKRISVAQIKQHKWVKAGWIEDNQVTMERVLVSPNDITNAVQDSFCRKEPNETECRIETAPMNAFEIASQFMMGSISTMATGEPIKRSTRFMANGDGETVKKRILEVLEKMKVNSKEKTKFEVRCFVYTGDVSNTIVSFAVIIIPTIVKELTIVEFQRGRGDVLEFQQFYRLFLQGIQGIVCSQACLQKTNL